LAVQVGLVAVASVLLAEVSLMAVPLPSLKP
jgi:hypothetical protein